MPPLSSHKTLSDGQKTTLRLWIEQGAEWKQHWAFVAPVRPAPPAVKDRKWARTPIDRFVLAKIEAAGLAPNPEADRRALIRRVSLDLTGLPPKPEDVAAFVADTSPDAYAKVVDKLLSSPHYGEHRARYWLDAARYGDTNGLHYDNYRGGIWPYRDWVVRAFNGNLPFDRFAVEQLAGDLLPNPTLDQRIATGFVRNNATTNENGVIEEEVRFQYIKDRADTAGTVFLGLTVGCATCHDHKFDPISQKDHYALEAFFNNTTERIMDNNRPDPPPVVIVPADRDRRRWLELEALRKSLRARMAAAHRAANARFDGWLAIRRARAVAGSAGERGAAGGVGRSRIACACAGPASLRACRSKPASQRVTQSPWNNGLRSLKFDGKSAMKLPGLDLTGSEPFSMAAWVYLPKIALHPGQTGGSHALVIAGQMTAGDAEAKPAGSAHRMGLRNRRRCRTAEVAGQRGKVIRAQAPYHKPVKAGTWNHLTFTYDGSRTEDGYAFYLNGIRMPIERGSYGAQDSTIAPELKESVKNTAPLTIGASDERREGDRGLGWRLPHFQPRHHARRKSRMAAAWPAIAAAASKDRAQLSRVREGRAEALLPDAPRCRLPGAAGGVRARERRASRDRAALEHGDGAGRTAAIRRPRRICCFAACTINRASCSKPRTPSFLPPMAPDLPRNRLGLARWMVDRANPLFSRVTVNRFWQELFGAGILESADDFGAQAQPPSHPELLDWLAVEFRESGWDVKKLITLIVTSATYRQSAAISQDKLRSDPKNILLARGPRFRLDGEVVRDSALAASGLLVTKLGGPPVKPYQPAGVWEGTSMVSSNTRNYKQDTGESLYRRSLYTLWKRQAPPASMDIFDGPTREVCVVRRERTNTPMQALVTMNDPQFVEAARVLAQKAMQRVGRRRETARDRFHDRSRARAHLHARRAHDRAGARIRISLAHYRANAPAAAQLLAVGESPADPEPSAGGARGADDGGESDLQSR